MTANQIAYHANVEKERANRASETLRANELEETARHNKKYEGIQQQQADASSLQAKAADRTSKAKVADTVIHGVDVVWGNLNNSASFFKPKLSKSISLKGK